MTREPLRVPKSLLVPPGPGSANAGAPGDVTPFRAALRDEFEAWVQAQTQRFPAHERLKVDLHCHDLNSDVPDELWGRILRLRETWLPTKELVRALDAQGCDLVTVTNHNNARSCWELLEKGRDVLVAAEFTCHVNDYELFLHVLAYGFAPAQEAVLNKKRRDIFEFVRYAAEQDIPLVLPHPLYFYTRSPKLSPELFEKLALMFQRFEGLNGQRDVWQSLLVLDWARGLTEEKLRGYARRHGLNAADFGVDVTKPKVLTGGSDDHMGLSAGTSGSYLHVPDLAARRRTTPLSQLALEALRRGDVVPYGQVGGNEKLSLALLDYFSQIATRAEDPGLLRLALHRGTMKDKLICFAIGNGLLEMKKHKKTHRTVAVVHEALHGTKPAWTLRWGVAREYRFCLDQLDAIADARKLPPEAANAKVQAAIATLFNGLSKLIATRLGDFAARQMGEPLKALSTEALIRRFEVPVRLSALLFGDVPEPGMDAQPRRRMDVGTLLGDVGFPLVAAGVVLASQVASARALNQNRAFLDDFALATGGRRHPRRALWLTDTLRDRNGVSSSLSAKLAEIQREGHPIDFLICHPDAASEPHLHVVRPITEVALPLFGEQKIRIPDLLEIARVFQAGAYDRIVCSTEGPMVVVALFLRYMFKARASFFMHTDWLDFIRHTTDLDHHERDRIRRLMRALYAQFESVFVLNGEHERWLTSEAMGLSPSAVHRTAHHVEPTRAAVLPASKRELFGDDPTVDDTTPVLLMAGRLSREKGVLDLPTIVRAARERLPNLRVVVAGTGPAEGELQAALPEARFLGWVSRERLDALYAGLDLFVFPSRFDTFGNVVLEALAQGLPVVAYDCKGPKDLIRHGRDGWLVPGASTDALAAQVVAHFTQGTEQRAAMRAAARERVQDYQAGPLMRKLLRDLGLTTVDVAVAEESERPLAA